MTRVLLSPDKFKGSVTAAEVAAALAAGMTSGDPTWDIVSLPVADGGDGTVDAAVAAGWDRVRVWTTGPTGSPVDTSYARRGEVAVVELASSVGLGLLPSGVPDPLGASTFGLGTVVAHALTAGARSVVIGLGGSASTDGGAGLLRALGARILDAEGHDLPEGGGSLREAAELDLAGVLPAARAATFQLACDVDNPLLGPLGATAVYAPQKGADAEQLLVLEQSMMHWASLVGYDSTASGAGAAGGTAYGAMAVLGATVRSGIDTVLELVDFHTQLQTADLVVTGEGSLDEQSLHGKAPIGVATAAHRCGVPVVTVSGRIVLSRDRLAEYGVVESYALSDLEPDLGTSIRFASTLLRRIGRTIATSTHIFEGVS
ncbi:glycerate kinase [Rhodococcoides trifolii]|uniref:Glycerate kinase n=1 Tax=Rhodococcoides trifolii TaxID=908250 RepID=A0A917D382_9NOCA|nr:glycerate kinase [Rhodococcus trifolii]GGG06772.1 glycerate kinase [Rhodococcus trifolii]